MNETAYTEPFVISASANFPKEKIARRKTVVYEAVVDPELIKVACEKLKQQLFAKFAFHWFQPKIEDIEFVSLEKCYEPYIFISGKYFINYLRKRAFTLEVDEEVREVIVRPNTYVPETSKSKKIVKLFGEERLIKEAQAVLILDRNGRDVDPDDIHLSSPEMNPEKVIEEFGIKELYENADVNFIKDRIVKLPKELCQIVDEIFEVTERTVVYCPRYKLLFRWTKTGEEKTLVLDAVTAEKVNQP